MSWQISTKNKLEIEQIEPLIKLCPGIQMGRLFSVTLIILESALWWLLAFDDVSSMSAS